MLKPFARLMLPVLLTMIVIPGCGREPQCENDGDCPEPGACSEVACNAGICETTTIDDCCGNGLCERAVENECTCSEDCGTCFGYISYTTEDGETVEAEYLQRRCSESNLCEVSYREEEQIYKEEFHEISSNGIVFDVVLSYPNPIAIRKNNIVIEIELVEITDPRVIYPLTITSTIVLDGSILFGRNDKSYQFESVGERAEIVIPVVGSVDVPEERHNMRVRIDFGYVYLDEKQVMEEGMLVYDAYGEPVMRTVREKVVNSTMVVRLAKTVMLIDPRAR